MLFLQKNKFKKALRPTPYLKWLVKNIQTIKTGEIIAEIETDKAVFEFESFNSGKIEIIAKEKEHLKVGDLLAKVHLEDNTETIITAPDLTKH